MKYRRKEWTFTPPKLMANRHTQTALGIHWPRRDSPYCAVQHFVDLEDGDQIVLHEDQPVGGHPAAPIVLIIHGLTGCYLSGYMCRLADKLSARGYRVVRMDMRGCGWGEAYAKLPNHCGRSSDLAAVLYYLTEQFPEAGITTIGYSMGGTIVLNLLAEAGEMRVGNLEHSFVICPPIDLVGVEQHFGSFWGRPYDRVFVKNIWNQVLRRWKLYPELAPSLIPRRPRRLRDIDETVLAPACNFKSAEDYYLTTSPGPKLKSICQPVTILSSEDDPVVPVDFLLSYPHSSAVEVITTKFGGHLGFLGKPNGDPDFRWLDWRIIEWIEQKRSHPPKKKLVVPDQVQRV